MAEIPEPEYFVPESLYNEVFIQNGALYKELLSTLNGKIFFDPYLLRIYKFEKSETGKTVVKWFILGWEYITNVKKKIIYTEKNVSDLFDYDELKNIEYPEITEDQYIRILNLITLIQSECIAQQAKYFEQMNFIIKDFSKIYEDVQYDGEKN